MRTSRYILFTLKETPTDTKTISHKLMLRAGMIRKLASGLYDWLPTGIRVLRKVENIIREEMNQVGAIEISMPIIQPANLWQKSNRLKEYGQELFSLSDRNKTYFILGPSHEEVITDLISNIITSHKQLPLNLYQIQTKFRDEIRPRFGVIRSREFIMKDAYSFHSDQNSLKQTYNSMYKAYNTIFTRIGFNFKVIEADTGSIGGNISHEFQILADNGENNIVLSDTSDYASSIELAEAICNIKERPSPTKNMQLVDTSNIQNIVEFIKQHKLLVQKTVKTLIVNAAKNTGYQFVALLIRGDHELNTFKAKKHPIVADPVKFATKEEIRSILKLSPSSLGPINLSIPMIIDRSVAMMSDFSAGANIKNKRYIGINWQRDLPLPDIYDLRNVVQGDPSPDGKGILQIKKGIEIGHIFQLGDKYSKLINATIQNKNGCNETIVMGCYGIGITRLIAAIIEQNHDSKGIIWPNTVAPFQVVILPINMHKSCRVRNIAEKLYLDLQINKIDVLFDDREEQPGVMFADMELIGIPYIIVISDYNLDKNKVEFKQRLNNKINYIKIDNIINFIKEKLTNK